jgi:hypothetical protein
MDWEVEAVDYFSDYLDKIDIIITKRSEDVAKLRNSQVVTKDDVRQVKYLIAFRDIWSDWNYEDKNRYRMKIL